MCIGWSEVIVQSTVDDDKGRGGRRLRNNVGAVGIRWRRFVVTVVVVVVVAVVVVVVVIAVVVVVVVSGV